MSSFAINVETNFAFYKQFLYYINSIPLKLLYRQDYYLIDKIYHIYGAKP